LALRQDSGGPGPGQSPDTGCGGAGGRTGGVDSMKVWATDRKGNTLCLGEPGEAELTYDREAPADLLEAVFPGEQWPELVWVTVELSGRRVFWGLVDEQ